MLITPRVKGNKKMKEKVVPLTKNCILRLVKYLLEILERKSNDIHFAPAKKWFATYP